MHVTFILDMFIGCYLMHNLLKFEDKESIGRLLHIIELKVVVHGKQMNKNVVVASDDNMN
jgi:hypothetical protein